MGTRLVDGVESGNATWESSCKWTGGTEAGAFKGPLNLLAQFGPWGPEAPKELVQEAL